MVEFQVPPTLLSVVHLTGTSYCVSALSGTISGGVLGCLAASAAFLLFLVLRCRATRQPSTRAHTAAAVPTTAATLMSLPPPPPDDSPSSISQVTVATDGSKASLPQQFRSANVKLEQSKTEVVQRGAGARGSESVNWL